MSDVRCPSCGDVFRIPDTELPALAIAVCPWCAAQWSIGELSKALPPPAVLLGVDGQPLPTTWTAPTSAVTESIAPAALSAFDNENLPALDEAELGEEDLASLDEFPALPTEQSEEDLSTVAETPREAGPFEEHDDTNLEMTEFEDPARDWDSERIADPENEAAPENEGTADWEEEDLDLKFGEPAPALPLSKVSTYRFSDDSTSGRAKTKAKRPHSALKSLVGIVFGGLLAFPLAGLLLALMGKPLDLGFWPFLGANDGPYPTRVASPPREVRDRPGPTDRSARPDAGGAEGVSMLPAGELDTEPDDLETDDSLALSLPEADEITTPSAPPRDAVAGPLEMPSSSEVNGPTDPLDLLLPPQSERPAVTADPELAAAPVLEPPSTRQGGDGDVASDLGLLPSDPPLARSSSTVADPLAAPSTEASGNPVGDLLGLPSDPESVAIAPRPNGEAEPSPNDSVAPELSPAPAPAEDAVAEAAVPSQPTPPQRLRPALAAVDTAIERLLVEGETPDTSTLRRRWADLYVSVAKLAEIVTPDDQVTLELLARDLAKRELIDDLGRMAPIWLGYPRRPSGGVLLVGGLESVAGQTRLQWEHETTVELRNLPESLAAESAEVLLLGKILEAGTQPVIEVVFARSLDL